ncbi:hypothetical protein [Bacillus thuringiensis]|uniref:Uncharacterized protein n=1 Tax=Bacillus thuringiensis TaxID=1428 RepID=A0A9W3YKM3_BACTU|nr:hypothetical protein [Bacillus thuringiensis]AMR06378.1 hypothetical protein AXW78_29200 [Bacillus thuringiensis]AYF85112.1 hypothetical protein D7J84_29310 [Bacillus thuringiensis]PNK35485.1 hypothetical protein CBR55_25195 [Bacillus thuringiensis]
MSQLKEAIEILESAFTDSRDRYPATVTNEHGTFPCIVSRTEHLEALIEMALDLLHEHAEEEAV